MLKSLNKDIIEREHSGAKYMTPTKSKVKEINDLDILTEPINIDITSNTPVKFLKDPNKIIPHNEIPEKIRNAIIENYGDDFFHEREWKLSTIHKLKKAISSPRENITNTIAQICGPNCNNTDLCPHDIVGNAPVGERCPQEMALMRLLYNEYMEAVSERLGTDSDQLKEDIIYHNLVMGLVGADIIAMRLDGTIAKDGFISEVPAVVNMESGQVYYKDEEAVAIRIKERVDKKRDQLYRQLLATPEMAEKYKRKGSQDSLARTAELVDRLEGIINNIDQKKIKDAEVIEDVSD